MRSLRSFAAIPVHHQRGVALLLTLTIIVLLTVLLLAFLVLMRSERQLSFNYSQSIKAKELGYTALQEITCGLRDEIIASSTVSGSVPVYVPGSRRVAMPAHVGFTVSEYTTGTDFSDKLPFTVLQTSRYNSGTFYNAADYDRARLTGTFASDVSTDEPAANGRAISASRWNKPRFMSGEAQPPSAFSNNPPQWVYLTRDGSRVCADSEVAGGVLRADLAGSNTHAVLARYAYVIYDEGAVLDINAAGSPGVIVSGGTNEWFTRKGAIAYADLTKLGLKQTDIDTFIKWRSKGTMQKAGDADGSKFPLTVAWSASNRFLLAEYGDSPLLGRQDMLQYLETIKASSSAPYLGTFTRTVSAPSWCPPFGAGMAGAADTGKVDGEGYFVVPNPTPWTPAANFAQEYTVYADTNIKPFDYKRNADDERAVNRNLPNVRWRSSKTVRHYRDDGSSFEHNVRAGEPLLMSRFSLAKLAWVASPEAPNSPTVSVSADAIRDCFGLERGTYGSANGGNACWKYVKVNADGGIKTLAEVAAEGREPNFFELLKAAILHGSLGKGTGPAAFSNGTRPNKAGVDAVVPGEDVFDTGGMSYDSDVMASGSMGGGPGGWFAHSYDRSGGIPAPSRIPDFQIIQIGANIIDQADGDSYPTAVYFPYKQVAGTQYDPSHADFTALYGPGCVAYGDENLPCLAYLHFLSLSPKRSGSDMMGYDITNCDTTEYAGWIQPSLWNPHQRPASLDGAPGRFEIRAYGAAYIRWSVGAKSYNNGGTYYYAFAPTDQLIPKRHRTAVSNPQAFYSGEADEAFKPEATLSFNNSAAVDWFTCPLPVTDDWATSDYSLNIAKPEYPAYNEVANGGVNHFVAFYSGSFCDAGAPYDPFYVGAVWDYATNPDNGRDNGKNVSFYPNGGAVASSTRAYKAATSMMVQPVAATTLDPCVTFALGWTDSGGGFHPYSFITGVFVTPHYTLSLGSQRSVGHAVPKAATGCHWAAVEPRSGRFSLSTQLFGGFYRMSLFRQADAYGKVALQCAPADSPLAGDAVVYRNRNFHTAGLPSPATANSYGLGQSNSNLFLPQDWAVNTVFTGTNFTYAMPTWYPDPDGVVRPGDAAFSVNTSNQGDGHPLLQTRTYYASTANPNTKYTAADSDKSTTANQVTASASTVSARHGQRPVILNRPFRNVGELGYVFRDQPFKTLDLFSPYSADAALLDVFSVQDETALSVSGTEKKLSSIIAGRVNPNNAPLPVLHALFVSALKKETEAGYTLNQSGAKFDQSANLAQFTVSALHPPNAAANPLSNRADLVLQLSGSVGYQTLTGWRYGLSSAYDSATVSAPATPANMSGDTAVKAYIEAPVRALATVSDFRAWNVMIDVIVQAGRFTPSARTLKDFTVEGECRYWLHLAIDRYTGRVIDQQLEPVYE